MKDRGFTLVEVAVVIVLLALVGGGVYVWQQKTWEGRTQKTDTFLTNKSQESVPTASPTATVSASLPTPTVDAMAGWKTITNAGGTTNVSFKYPADWTGPGKDGGCIHLTTPDNASFCYVQGPYINSGETVDGLISRISASQSTITAESSKTIDGHTAKTIEYKEKDGSKESIETYIADVALAANSSFSGRKGTLVVGLYGTSLSDRDRQTYDQVLSTYKLGD